MSRNIETWTEYDPNGNWVLKIRKKRGRLSIDEVTEAATLYDEDFYMLVIKAMDLEMEQYYTTDDLNGDFVTLYRADDFFDFRNK